MFLAILLVSLLVLITLAYYKFVLKPKKLMTFYRNAFGRVFKVFEYPFEAMQGS
jgi:hypothetical protein